MDNEKFGQSFHPDSVSRVNVLDDSLEIPDYVDFSRQIRKLLKSGLDGQDSGSKENWPECPKNLKKVEDFFEAARQAVTLKWRQVMPDILKEKCAEWLEKIPNTEKNQGIKELLKHPDELDERLRIMQFGRFEPLRQINHESWRSLLLISSERQLAVLTLLRYWVKDGLTEEDFVKMGVGKPELELMLDAAGILGKYIDHAYVKQVELADEPGGSAKNKLGARRGAEYLYDIHHPPTGKIDKKTYAEVFPAEWPKIINGLNNLAQKTETLIKEGKLPATYRQLPGYLNQLAEAYGSSSVSPKKLSKMWEDVFSQMVELTKQGCPIMIFPGSNPSVAGEANKTDVDLRFGLRTKENINFENSFADYVGIAQKYLDDHRGVLSEKESKIPPVIINIQPLAFGSNLYFFTIAETGKKKILSHRNANNDLAKVNYYPIYKNVLPEQYAKMEEEDFLTTVNKDSVLHEISHNIFSIEDEAILRQIGVSNEANILDEVKAEALSLWLVREKIKNDPAEKQRQEASKFLIVKILTVGSYLNLSSDLGSDGERYYFTGAAIISALLDNDILVEKGSGYAVTDPLKGLELIANFGQEIVDKFYLNPKSTKNTVVSYGQEIRKIKNDPRLKKFIATIKK